MVGDIFAGYPIANKVLDQVVIPTVLMARNV